MEMKYEIADMGGRQMGPVLEHQAPRRRIVKDRGFNDTIEPRDPPCADFTPNCLAGTQR